MTQKYLVTIELIEIFAAYYLAVIVPPAIVFGEKLKKRELSYTFRMMAYFMIGNFFAINKNTTIFVIIKFHQKF